ncbi:hypothetical protein HYS97_02545 [Candidatus Daviesbacteria bacterium]|nr:hypothetical protein [Candidatus Daviesbacteria bacterium]
MTIEVKRGLRWVRVSDFPRTVLFEEAHSLGSALGEHEIEAIITDPDTLKTEAGKKGGGRWCPTCLDKRNGKVLSRDQINAQTRGSNLSKHVRWRD